MLGQFSFDEDLPGAQTPGLSAPSYAPQGPGTSTQPPPSFNTGAPPSFSGPSAPKPATPAAGATAAPRPAVPNFSSMVSSVHVATDPVDQAQQHDALARALFTSLQQQGHQVKWQGSQLIVDGRPYSVAGASGASTDTAVPRTTTTARTSVPGIAPGEPTPGSFPNAGGGGTTTNTGPYAPVQGFDFTKLSTGGGDPAKYTPAVRGFSQGLGSGVQLSRGNLGGMVSYLQAHGFANAHAVGDGKIDFGDGNGPIDVIMANGQIWFQNGPDRFGGAAPAGVGPVSSLSPVLQNALTRTVSPPVFNSGGGAASQAGITGGFTPGQGPTYTPGDITFDDIPSLSYDDIYNSLTGPGNETEQASDALLQHILEHPESIDDHTLDTMKAKSKDELAEQQAMDESDLRGFGVANGIDDSRWLQSERLASRRDRDRALTASNRDLEVTAATTNTADRRAASQLGISYQGQKASQRQAASTLAADTTLRESGLRQDRMALREQVNQKAAELGQSSDQIMSQWLLGLMDDATRRYGIDVGANVDMAKLGEQSQEFKEDLAFRILALEQNDRQFGATYGLDFLKTQGALDRDAFTASQGGAGNSSGQ